MVDRPLNAVTPRKHDECTMGLDRVENAMEPLANATKPAIPVKKGVKVHSGLTFSVATTIYS